FQPMLILPISRYVPSGAVIRSPSSTTFGLPTSSMTTSPPQPSVSALTCFTRASGVGCSRRSTIVSAPNRRASARRSSTPSTTSRARLGPWLETGAAGPAREEVPVGDAVAHGEGLTGGVGRHPLPALRPAPPVLVPRVERERPAHLRVVQLSPPVVEVRATHV